MSGGGTRESILGDLLTALTALKNAPVSPYNTQVKHVSRDLVPIEELVRATQFPALFIVAGEQETDPDFEHTLEYSTLTAEIVGIVQSRTGLSTALNKLVEDVKRKLMEDRTRGTVAIDTKFRGVPEVDEESLAGDGIGGFRLRLGIPYTHAASEI